MNTNTDPQPEPYELANFGDRAFARMIDAFVMAAFGFVMMCAIGIIGVLSASSVDNFDDLGTALYVPGLMLVPASLLAVRYEVAYTSRRGYSSGKGPTVQVILWEEYQNPTGVNKYPDMYHSFIRWLIPHGVLIAGLVISMRLWYLADQGPDAMNPLLFLLGPVGWVLMYLTTLLDKNRRGWNDKAAGTIVVKAPRPDPARPWR